MLKELSATLRWTGKLAIRFFQVFPLGTSLTIVVMFISQIALVASVILPLKVIMLMGSQGDPRFLPDSLTYLDHKTLILSLSIFALSAYIFHEVAEKIASLISQAGIRRLLASSGKLQLFEDQDLIAETAYRRFSQAAATGAFFILSLTIVGLLYPDALLALVLFLALSAATIAVSLKIKPPLQTSLAENVPKFANALSGLAFLFLFIYVIFDFMFLSIPQFMPLIISIILARQSMSRLSNTAINIYHINRQREKLSALFFSHHTYQSNAEQKRSDLWNLVTDEQFKNQVREVLTEHLQSDPGKVELIWHQTGVKNILFLFVGFKELEHQFLLKIFDQKRNYSSSHEATLLFDMPDYLPAPKLLEALSIQGYRAHLFDCPHIALPVNTPSAELKASFNEQLLWPTPSEELVVRCVKSQTMLWNRINIEMIDRLRDLATPKERSLLKDADSILTKARTLLKETPLVIHNRDQSPDTIYIREDGKLGNLHWSRWTLEPVGAGWPTNAKSLHRLTELLSEERSGRPLTDRVSAHKAIVAAICFRLDQTYTSQRYASAIKLLLRLKSLIDENSEGKED